MAGDDHALDLVGPLIDLARLGVAETHRGRMVGGAGLRGAQVHGGLRNRDARVR